MPKLAFFKVFNKNKLPKEIDNSNLKKEKGFKTIDSLIKNVAK